MTNKSSTKRALFTSALAVLLCLSMLVGTTFAWFTDSVTSSGNKIVAGTLKIDLEVLDKKTGAWNSVKESKDPIFSYELWEPGYTEVKVLKVRNEGSLALKWKATLVSDAKLTKLADVIDVYVKEGVTAYPTERELTGWTKKGTLAEFINTIETTTVGTLEANAEATLGIAFKMQETAGNEYQGKDLGGEFDICILATQYTKESDSFDEKYDENATFGTYIELNAGDDLLAALASAAADQPVTIKLLGDVEWPTEGHHGENDITRASSIVIDGNGKTITATGSGVTPLGDDKAPMTLKNVKIVDNSASYNESAWELTYLEMGGTKLTCENVTFADEIQTGTNATFTNCSFESNEASVYAVWVEDGSAIFTNCTFTGYRGLKVHEEYGTEVSSVIVKDCTFKNITKKPGIALGRICMNGDTYTTGGTTYTNTTDTTVSITGSTFINCQAGDQGLYIYETDTDVNTFDFTEENNTLVTEATVSSADDLIDALNSDATSVSIELAGDIEFEKITAIEPGKEVYLNLNGNTITVDENTTSNTLIWVKDGAKLTIDGNGTIDLGSVSTMAIFCPYGELVIENGTFTRDKVTTVTDDTTGLFMGAKSSACNVTINGGYFDPGYYDANAADIEAILAGTKTFTETADDIAKRGQPGDKNAVRVAVKDNVSVVLNHSGYGSFKVYGGTFVGANPAWGDEGCMLPTTPNYLRPWSYYQGALLAGQTFNENGIVIPEGYTITQGTTADGVPTYTVEYNK